MYKRRKQKQGPKVPKRPPKKGRRKLDGFIHSVQKITQNVSFCNITSEDFTKFVAQK